MINKFIYEFLSDAEEPYADAMRKLLKSVEANDEIYIQLTPAWPDPGTITPLTDEDRALVDKLSWPERQNWRPLTADKMPV